MSPVGRRVVVVLGAWCAGALAVTLSGALELAPTPVAPATLATELAVLVALFAGSPGFRAWVLALGVGPLTFLHVWRLVPGAAFLLAYDRGRLPWAFAVPAGLGDLAVAVTAPFAAWLGPARATTARRTLVAWHALALADLVNVVATAARLGLRGDAQIRLLLTFPWALLPTILVPLTLMAHVVALASLLSRGR